MKPLPSLPLFARHDKGAGRIYLIPVRFEECNVPFSLSRYQGWICFSRMAFLDSGHALNAAFDLSFSLAGIHLGCC
jgi:hypothetical protein